MGGVLVKYIKVIKARGYSAEEGKHIFNTTFEVVDDFGDIISVRWPDKVRVPEVIMRMRRKYSDTSPLVMVFSKEVGDKWKYVDGKEFVA
jgi:hypothetical protein